ncbi:MAG: SRPBCC family protein [Cumulibacter sp.]
MEFVRTIATPAAPSAVFEYLADFRSTTQWDPGTVETHLIRGDGGVGSEYRNRSRFLGRETVLIYVVEEHRADSRIVLRGQNDTVRVRDTMTITPAAGGRSEVTYRAKFAFRGSARLLTPILWIALRRLVDSAAHDLGRVLATLRS